MLTLQETRWSLNTFKILSALNILPIKVDVESGKIQGQASKTRVFMWKILFGVGVSHWFYIFGRLLQPTILEPEKYFRWDHFVLHFGLTGYYAVFYFTGFCLFVKNAEENVIIFNQLLVQREDPVQKMMDQLKQLEIKSKSGNGNGNENPVTKITVKSEAPLESTSAQESQDSFEDGENEVIEEPSKSESEVCPRPLFICPLQYSLDEILAKFFPLVLLITAVCLMLILAVDPSRPQLLFSSLPPEYRNPSCFILLLAVETLSLSIPFYTSAFAIVIQVLFFGKVQLEFKQMSLTLRNLRGKFQNCSLGDRDIEREIWMLRQILEEMQKLVLFIELFNQCFPFCIFAWKVYSLSISIIWFSFFIRYNKDFPILAVFIGYCATATTLAYTIMYEHAFSIPGKMDGLKEEFLLTAQKTTSASNTDSNGNKLLWWQIKKEIKKIRGVGIKVKSFHQMERESTPKFVDFVLRNVVTLLVTAPR